jgi:hypothetical protein
VTVAQWEPGTLYVPGAVVRPRATPTVVPVSITNPGFEAGDTGWTKETGWTISNAGGFEKYTGSWSAQFDNTSTTNRILATAVACLPGQSITASCFVSDKGGASGSDAAGGAVLLRWLTAASAEISVSEGNAITRSEGGWKRSTVTATAPDTAAFVQIGARGFRTSGSDKIWVDAFAWNHVTQAAPLGLIYEATQAAPGTSANVEPVWPTSLAGTVVDGGVTWTAVSSNRITWTASPIMQSGVTEPTWPTEVGLHVAEGNISWECIGRNIQDAKCPNTTVVAIAASKVFAADADIVRFCATVNPLDWSSANDAGYLPTGIQQSNANDAAVLGLYRSNLVVFNAGTFQMWQVDPDPAAMALLDQIEGIGSEHPQAAQAVGDELFFLSQLGVRTVGIAAGSTNLSAGDVGEPVDSLALQYLAITRTAEMLPVATYFPSAGQFWIAFPGDE